MKPEQVVEAAVVEFSRRVEALGWGGVGRLRRKLGVGKNYFSRWKQAKRVRLLPLLQALEILQVEPAEFFQTVFTPRSRTIAKPGRIVGAVLRRQVCAVPGQPISKESSAAVQALAIRRYENPQGVLEEIERKLAKAQVPTIPWLLGVAGSAHRMLLELAEALGCFEIGLKIALERRDHSAVGDLLQKRSYVLTDDGQLEDAITSVDQALVKHQIAGSDPAALGRAMFDRARVLYYQRHFLDSVDAYEAALRSLPKTEVRNRSAAYQGLGLVLADIGECDLALDRLADGEKEAPPELSYMGGFAWLRGRIARKGGDLDSACHELSRALEIYLSALNRHFAGQAALVGVEFVEALFMGGRLLEAKTVASRLSQVAIVLSDNVAICGALNDIVFCAHLSAELIRTSQKVLRAELGNSARNWVNRSVR